MNLMIVTNSAYLEPTYMMLYSLFKQHLKEQIDIYMPYEDIKESELIALTKFVDTFSGKKLYPLNVGSDFKAKVNSRNGINVETYYRILGISLLPQSIERILYLDVDIIIRGSLMKLYETELGEAAFAVCEDIYGIINGFHEANKKRLSIPQQYSYFNAGVMLYNLKYLRETNAIEQMLQNIYKKYERYEYNDQDVMNEMYYDNVLYLGWDEYNCPPVWCYLDKQKIRQGVLEFADYNEIRRLAANPEIILETYQDITMQIYQNAKVIHYLGNTKPWNKKRPESKVYEMFDEAYINIKVEMQQKFSDIF